MTWLLILLFLAGLLPVARSVGGALSPQPQTRRRRRQANADLVTMLILLAITFAAIFVAFGGGAQ